MTNNEDAREPSKARVAVGLTFISLGFICIMFGSAVGVFGGPVSTIGVYAGCAFLLFGVVIVARTLRRS